MPSAVTDLLGKGVSKQMAVREDGVDWRNASQVAGWMLTAYEDGKQRKHSWERRMVQNMLFANGQHYVQWDDDKRRFVPMPEARPWIVRLTINLQRGYIDDYVTRMTASKPSFDLTPRTSSVDDEDQAFVGSRIARWDWDKVVMTNKLIDAMYLVAMTGNALIHSFWNPEKGRKVDVDTLQQGSPLANTFGADAEAELAGSLRRKPRTKLLGEPDAEVLSLWQITEDPSANSLDDARYIQINHERTIDWVRMRYGDAKANKLNPETSNVYPLNLMDGQAIDIDVSLFPRKKDPNERTSMGTVIVSTLYRLPDSRHKRGTYAVSSQGNSLTAPRDTPTEYPMLRLPLIHLGFSWVPGQFWYGTPCTDCINLQYWLNRVHSSMVEVANMTSSPIITAEKGSVDWSRFTGEPGSRVTFKQGSQFPPKYMEQPEVPVYMRQIPEWIRSYMDDLWSDHKTAQGKADSANQSGRAIRQLQEASMARHAAQRDRMETAIGRFGSQQLSIIAENMEDRRLFVIVGEDGQRSFNNWSRQHFAGQKFEDFDVKANMYTRLGHTRVGIREDTEILVRLGILNPENPEHVDTILRRWGWGGRGLDLDQDKREARSEAWGENHVLIEITKNPQAMFENQNDPEATLIPRPVSGQDHGEHKKHHLRLKRSLEYDSFGPEQKQALDQHIEAHDVQAALDIFRPLLIAQQIKMKLGLMPPPGAEDGQKKPPGNGAANGNAQPGTRNRKPERAGGLAGGGRSPTQMSPLVSRNN